MRAMPDADDEAETAGASRGDAGSGVLEHHACAGGTPRRRAASRNMSGAGFPARPRRSRSMPSTRASKSAVKRPACRISAQWWLDEATAMRTPRSAGLPEKNHGRVEHLYALARQKLEKIVILAAGKPVNRCLFRPIPGSPMGTSMPRAARKLRHACEAWFAVDIAAIVGLEVEGDEWGAGLRRLLGKKLVKELLPSAGVDRCRLCDHAVQVEDEGLELSDIDGDHGGRYRSSRSRRNTITGQMVSRMTRRMVRARSGSSTPRQPRTMRSLRSAARNRRWPSRPRLERPRDGCRPRPLRLQPRAADRETPAPRPATRAGAGRRSAGRPTSQARWAAPHPASRRAARRVRRLPLMRSRVAGPIVAALVGVPSCGNKQPTQCPVFAAASWRDEDDGARRRAENSCGHAAKCARPAGLFGSAGT